MSLPSRPASSRRTFLQHSALSLGALSLSQGAGLRIGSEGTRPLRIGVVGLGRAGRRHLQSFLALPDCQVQAVCDVYETRQEWARARVNAAYGNKDCNTFTDFRDLLRSEELDALVVATPDHWHTWMTLAALRSGLDVFCESPGMRTLNEGQELDLMQARTGRILQRVMPWREHASVRRLHDLVRRGRLGPLREVIGEMEPGRAFERIAARPHRVPEDLRFDLWLGPVPAVPYHPKRCEGFAWIRDYAAGRLTSQGLPLLDLAGWLLDVPATAKARIRATGDYPSRGLFDNPLRLQTHLQVEGQVPWTLRTGGAWGLTLVGTKGRVTLRPESGGIEATGDLWSQPLRSDATPAAAAKRPGLAEDFLQSIRLRRPARCALAAGRPAANWSYGAEIALEVGRAIQVDGRGTILDDPGAAAWSRRPRRPQWTMKM